MYTYTAMQFYTYVATMYIPSWIPLSGEDNASPSACTSGGVGIKIKFKSIIMTANMS